MEVTYHYIDYFYPIDYMYAHIHVCSDIIYICVCVYIYIYIYKCLITFIQYWGFSEKLRYRLQRMQGLTYETRITFKTISQYILNAFVVLFFKYVHKHLWLQNIHFFKANQILFFYDPLALNNGLVNLRPNKRTYTDLQVID